MALIYSRSLRAPFVYDDFPSIADNPTLRSLHRLGAVLSPPPAAGVGGRPLLNLSYALNFAASGSSVVGYHLVNLAIHVLAGWVLFGLIRRTLLLPGLAMRYQSDATLLALVTTALWQWHPVQTQSVTYLSQRAESLMGLWYLLCLYCFLRANTPVGRPRAWTIGCIASCVAGMATKETMVTAPFAVLLYDRTFLSDTWSQAWRRHRGIYLALAATLLLTGLLLAGVGTRGVGFSGGIGAGTYALTETRALLRYLALIAWPHPLIFDYGEPWVRNLGEGWRQALVVVALLGLTVWALARKPRLGFALGAFFLLLAPTSSFIPVAGQPIAENRLYLPLAPIVCLAVLGAYAWRGRRSLWFAGAAAVLLAAATAVRNEDYRSAIALWRDTVRHCPENARARNNLGQVLLEGGAPSDLPEAAAEMEAALRLAPGIKDAAEIQNNLGDALSRLGRLDDATAHFRAAIRLKPAFSVAHYNLGNALAAQSRTADAGAEYAAAIQLNPGYARAHNNLGMALHGMGRDDDALREVEIAVRLDPNLTDARFNLGCALMAAGRRTEAVGQFQQMLRLQPDSVAAKAMLARLGAVAP